MMRSELVTAFAFLPKAKALTCEPVLLQWQGGKSESSWFPPPPILICHPSALDFGALKYRPVQWRACRDPRRGH
ncbi:hypothetical protein FB45DRAFT_910318 [Roridomyces roridus]|uniref:Uncharacterized protein n=1 Tax=Roridomyces roridus TaxID=1738132 RepID=A0AAD7BZK9_9AGAR|nr:hypothetical protein FB45DRAFT_910318 [Roridomyces roridus]